MTSYYNEVDKHAAAWLRELVKAGHIADGIVDERDIQDVLPSDLAGFTQCHFFAGIGVWSYALRKAGWPDDRPVWTGSCPCQPFSSAGKGSAFADERHLWPAFHHLIKECRPPVVFGEQVAGSAINPWVDLVHADLEAVGYAFGCVPFPSASVGAPHIRDRLYWVADSSGARLDQRQRVAGIPGQQAEDDARQAAVGNGVCSVVGMAYSDGWNTGAEREQHGREQRQQPQAVRPADWAGGRGGLLGGLDDPKSERPGFFNPENVGTTDAQINLPTDTGDCQSDQSPRERLADSSTSPTNGFWRDADWLLCRDGKFRPVEPGTFPLVARTPPGVVRGGSDGLPIDSDKTGEARVMRLRGYGNSINAVQAQAFVEAFMDYQQQVSA